MRILKANRIPHPDGSRVALVQREHDTTPFIVVGIDGSNRPMIECGFKGCCDIESGVAVFNQVSQHFDIRFSTM